MYKTRAILRKIRSSQVTALCVLEKKNYNTTYTRRAVRTRNAFTVAKFSRTVSFLTFVFSPLRSSRYSEKRVFSANIGPPVRSHYGDKE